MLFAVMFIVDLFFLMWLNSMGVSSTVLWAVIGWGVVSYVFGTLRA